MVQLVGQHHRRLVTVWVSLLVLVIDVRHQLLELWILSECVKVLLLYGHLIIVLAIVQSHLDLHV